MKNEHRPCALTNDEVTLPMAATQFLPSTVLGRSWMETQLAMVSCEALDRQLAGGVCDDA